MTKESSVKIATWAVPIAIGTLLAIGAARVQLAGKEDTTAHNADVVMLQGQIASVRTDAEKREIRDSADKADTRRMIRDLACDSHPTKDYCK